MLFNKHFQLKPYFYKFERFKNKERENQQVNILKFDDRIYNFGGQSILIHPENVSLFIDENLNVLYHRKNLALKVIDTLPLHPYTNVWDVFWGANRDNDPGRLLEGSKIQNFFATENLAPRVYDIVFLTDRRKNIKYAAQVTEFLTNDPNLQYTDSKFNVLVNETIRIGLELGIEIKDIPSSNIVDFKFVDFQRFSFKSYFKPYLVDRINENLGFGDATPYQSVESLGIKGKRENLERFSIIDKHFKKQKLTDFTVADIGCNGGFFLRRAFDWGANYGIGIDKPHITKIAQQINYYFGYFNADFAESLPDSFDVMFFFSMHVHVPIENFIPHCNKLFYLETNADERKEDWYNYLNKQFPKVSYLGYTEKPDKRHLFVGIR